MNTSPVPLYKKWSAARFVVLATLLAWFVVVGEAQAGLAITAATVGGGASVSVAPGGNVTVSYTVSVTAGNAEVEGTDWRISTTAPGGTTCTDSAPDSPNNTNGTYTTGFTATAPGTPGTYNLYLIANDADDCGGGQSSATYVLPNAVIVLPEMVISSATVNGAASATVVPGASVSVSYSVVISGGNQEVEGSLWRISTTAPGGTTCANSTPDSPSDTDGTYTTGFTATAPATVGTYNLYLIANSADDCGGGGSSATYTLPNALVVQEPPPSVTSINRSSFDPTSANTSVTWAVSFDSSVTGVDTADFVLVQVGGTTGASITSVTGSGTTWTVTANTGSGTSGTLRLNLVDNDTITGLTGLKLGGTGSGNGNYTGELYTLLPPVCTGVAPEIFCDDFERSSSGGVGNGWTVTPANVSNCTGTGINTGCAGIDSDIPPFSTYSNPRANPTRSMFTRWNIVTVSSPVINLAGRSGGQLSFWIRRGHDDFSECPEAAGENYLVNYLASDNTWKTLAQYPSSPSAGLCDGKIWTPTIELPADALHANFQMQFYQPSGSGKSGSGGASGVVGYDYWHMDNVIVREVPAPTFIGAFCDNFEGGLGRWSIGAEGSPSGSTIGDADLGTLTNKSPTHSLDLRWGYVTASTFKTDLTGVSGNITYWVKSGTTADRDPDSGENLVVEYLNNTGNWTNLATYLGADSAGTVYEASHSLPADAIHANFRLRFRHLNSSGYDRDYWHVDDVCVGTIVPTADLAMNMTRNSLLTPGSNATYSLSVQNNGPDAVSGTIEVVDTLPTGLSYLSATGSGWNCTANGQVITCNRSGALSNGATTPVITLTVTVAAGLTGIFTNTATVSGTVIDNTAANNTATDSFTIEPYCLDTYAFDGADGASPGTDWLTTKSSGSFGLPRIMGNRLRLTDASNDVATAAHLQKMFPAAGNKIVVEFDYYAYSGNGADGIALTFSDALVTPYAGAYGGSLGYAQKTGINGFAGGWLGIGLDEYGNFRNDEEGRGDGGTPTGLVPDSVSIRGSGSGTVGYLLQAESGALTPGVDVSTGHRYRITIDHSDSNNAFVHVERNTGSGYATVIPNYNAKAVGLGQAAVPESWLLSFTGSTGSSTNIHEIDNLSICAAVPILSMGPDHYVISHSGTGLTCEAEPVTFTAHDASHARVGAAGKTLSISTSSNSGTWVNAADGCTRTCFDTAGAAATCTGTFTATTGNNGQASYLFGTGETGVRLCLKHNASATVNMNVTDGTATEASGTAASDATPGADPSIVFSNTGFRFYADGSVDTLGNLIAGLRSDTVDATLQPTPQAITIRALKSSETTPARCVSLLGATAKTIQFAYQCTDPAACHASSDGLEINGTAVAGSAAVPTPASNVSVTFDGSGTGSINLKYWDVGQIKLYAQASIADAVTGGSAAIVTGASNAFVVKPHGFSVKACTGTPPCTTANTSATDGTGSVFAKAGDPFNATVTAVAYGGTVVTPSFGLGTGNGTETVQLAQSLVAPSGGSAGALGGTTALPRSSFTDGVASTTNLSWSEVGVMTLAATNNSFQTIGAAASGTSGNIGRFTPHHFGVTGTAVTRSDLQVTEGQATPFTYMGEPLKLTLVVTAYNKTDGVAQNYVGSFAKLDATTLGTGANWFNTGCSSSTQCMGLGAVNDATTDTGLSGRLSIDTGVASPSGTWLAGVGTFTAHVMLARNAAPDGPYDILKYGAMPRDSDGITLPGPAVTDPHKVDLDATTANTLASNPDTTNERRYLLTTASYFGRLWLGNAYGSDKRGLSLPYEAQYWNGNVFVKNAKDSLTPFAVGNISLATSLTTTPTLAAMAAGAGTIALSAPNAAGSVDVYINLDSAGMPVNCQSYAEGTTVARSYLSGKWCGAAYDRDPVARATFGIYGGRKGPIYIRENY